MFLWETRRRRLIVGNHPLGVGHFQTGVRRRKYKLGPTKQKTVPGISSLARVYISSSSPSLKVPYPSRWFPPIKVVVEEEEEEEEEGLFKADAVNEEDPERGGGGGKDVVFHTHTHTHTHTNTTSS